mmetsp:Transcript_35777/g.105768  ORF Transcript_35777/g.105768 Transcript_35777/m.105768 type:complete len:219 (+) Transcript_35777:1274-1930(+)
MTSQHASDSFAVRAPSPPCAAGSSCPSAINFLPASAGSPSASFSLLLSSRPGAASLSLSASSFLPASADLLSLTSASLLPSSPVGRAGLSSAFSTSFPPVSSSFPPVSASFLPLSSPLPLATAAAPRAAPATDRSPGTGSLGRASTMARAAGVGRGACRASIALTIASRSRSATKSPRRVPPPPMLPGAIMRILRSHKRFLCWFNLSCALWGGIRRRH